MAGRSPPAARALYAAASKHPQSSAGARLADFRSDTVTRPTRAMLAAGAGCAVGDDVYGDDPSVARLEARVAQLTGHAAALFCVSGTMSNQIAIRTHLSQPPHSVLCDREAHVFKWEGGGIAFHSAAQAIALAPANHSPFLTLEDVAGEIVEGDDVHVSPTRLVCVENTINGAVMPVDEIRRISEFTRSKGIKLHLDGARLWHASVKTDSAIADFTRLCDSVSLCFSKGLGAPIGSVLVGDKDYIAKARRFRKIFGGGWRQAGILAGYAEHALTENYPTVIEKSHELAALFAEGLRERLQGRAEVVRPVETNMVWMRIVREERAAGLGEKLAARGVLVGGVGKNGVLRVVMHLDVAAADVELLLELLCEELK